MGNIFKILPDLSSYDDDILSYIESISKRDFSFPSGLIFVPYEDFERNFEEANRILHDKENQSWGIFQDEINKMGKELNELIQSFKDFYLSKTDYSDISIQGLSPQEISYLIIKAVIRIKRLICVLDSDYSTIEFQDKKTKNKYTMIKGYYINENGVRKRIFSRNIGNKEQSLIELFQKVIKSNLKGVEVFENVRLQVENRKFKYTVFDLFAIDGKRKWAIEFKNQNKDNLIRTFVMLEMWKLYQKSYELIS